MSWTTASSRAAAATGFAVTLSILGRAGADPTAFEKAMAEQLFRKGKQLLADDKMADTCAKLTESLRIDAKLGTLLNLATCHEREGKTASAWAEFTEAASEAKKAGQESRVDFARDHARQLEKRLSRVIVRIASPPAGVVIRLDGKELSAAAVGSPIPLDPGDYGLEVGAPGKQAWTSRVAVAPGPVIAEVTVPALRDETASVEPPAARPTADPAPPRDGGLGPRRVVGLVVAGVGVVGIGVGAYFGARTFSKQGVVEDNCSGALCNRMGLDADDAAHTSATISTIAIAAGAACVAAGAVVFFTAPGPRERTSLWIAPRVAGPSGTLSVGGAL